MLHRARGSRILHSWFTGPGQDEETDQRAERVVDDQHGRFVHLARDRRREAEPEAKPGRPRLAVARESPCTQVPNGELELDWTDEITAGTCVTRQEEVAA